MIFNSYHATSIKSLGAVVSLDGLSSELLQVNQLEVDTDLREGPLSHTQEDPVNELFSADLALPGDRVIVLEDKGVDHARGDLVQCLKFLQSMVEFLGAYQSAVVGIQVIVELLDLILHVLHAMLANAVKAIIVRNFREQEIGEDLVGHALLLGEGVFAEQDPAVVLVVIADLPLEFLQALVELRWVDAGLVGVT